MKEYDYFRNINLKFIPGNDIDQMKVIYDFKDKLPYFLTASHFVDRFGNPSVTT